ncbi:patatin-like phospholipase family protein [Xinfangfangia sp. D13-10-4-6]|uniref:patatin-like phospholipase family protein n=1 Tax=Pseudogemmobacter hezensis TaxID=2737662 RepID=UPI0015542FA2|nr:patatin-like phospholipase family protein [Pseudogemmobacter hezensis]NPD15657.1 patatin-like phospholipase family protein [Pseudogemmobacter hezensis]
MTKISLALQGGGAHGAYTWGVLDRILEDGRLEIAAISGTSAGALNGAALKAGLVAGGREAARKRLRRLWESIGDIGDFRVLLPWFQPMMPIMRLMQEAGEAMLPFSASGIAAQIYSPYSWGDAWQNPLAPVVADLDFSQVCTDAGPALFIGATNVRTGKARVFTGSEISPEALMASACLPSVFQAVEIDGEAYWDGGFAGNPSLWPLYDRDLPDDILIIHVNPLRRDEVPETPLGIQNRVNEISFNATLLSELRSVAFVKRLIAEGRIERGQMKDLHIHLILDDALMNALSAGSKLQPSSALISRLFEAGRASGDAFLAECGAKIGHESSADLAALFG